MLSIAEEGQKTEVFRNASEEVAALGERLRELRGVMSMRLEAPRTSHDGEP